MSEPHDRASLARSTLCLVPGKVAWTVHVDAVVLTYDGALVDAVSVAIRAALLSTRLPHVEVVGGADGDDEPQIEVDDEPEHR